MFANHMVTCSCQCCLYDLLSLCCMHCLAVPAHRAQVIRLKCMYCEKWLFRVVAICYYPIKEICITSYMSCEMSTKETIIHEILFISINSSMPVVHL